jgi:hypothetical protein
MHRRARHFNARDAGASLVLDSRFITGLADGDPVSTWSDRSGNNNSPTAVTTQRPLYKVNEQSGNPAVRFDGTDDRLVFSSAFISGSTPGSCVYTFKIDNDPPTAAISAGAVLGFFGSGGGATHIPWIDGNIYDKFGSTQRKTVGNPTQSLTSSRIIAVHSDASDWQFFIDSVNFFTTTSNSVGWTQNPEIGGELGFSYLKGIIMSITVLNFKMTSSLRRRIEHAAALSFKIPCN